MFGSVIDDEDEEEDEDFVDEPRPKHRRHGMTIDAPSSDEKFKTDSAQGIEEEVVDDDTSQYVGEVDVDDFDIPGFDIPSSPASGSKSSAKHQGSKGKPTKVFKDFYTSSTASLKKRGRPPKRRESAPGFVPESVREPVESERPGKRGRKSKTPEILDDQIADAVSKALLALYNDEDRALLLKVSLMLKLPNSELLEPVESGTTECVDEQSCRLQVREALDEVIETLEVDSTRRKHVNAIPREPSIKSVVTGVLDELVTSIERANGFEVVPKTKAGRPSGSNKYIYTTSDADERVALRSCHQFVRTQRSKLLPQAGMAWPAVRREIHKAMNNSGGSNYYLQQGVPVELLVYLRRLIASLKANPLFCASMTSRLSPKGPVKASAGSKHTNAASHSSPQSSGSRLENRHHTSLLTTELTVSVSDLPAFEIIDDEGEDGIDEDLVDVEADLAAIEQCRDLWEANAGVADLAAVKSLSSST